MHNEQTRSVLLDAAEQLVERNGAESLSVRRVADEVGTSTRAVYSLFGSRAGLVDALGSRAFEWLAGALDAQVLTGDPVADLIDAGACVFRRLVVEHPGLLQIGVQRPKATAGTHTHRAAERALAHLLSRLERLQDAGMLRDQSPRQAAWQFHALCEGLAALELRGDLPTQEEEPAWRVALTTLVRGMLAPVPAQGPQDVGIQTRPRVRDSLSSPQRRCAPVAD